MPKTRKAPRGTRVPQQARSRRTRERILQAAVACFEDRGYDRTTTAAIARRARVAVGTLYGYFEDKRAILIELIEVTMSEVADYVIRGLEPELWRNDDPRATARGLIDAVFHTRSFNPGMQRIVWERFFKDEEVRTQMEAIEARIRQAIADLLAELKAEGRVRVDDVQAAAYLIQASIEWVSTRLFLESESPDSEARIDAAVEAATDMISRYLFR